MVLYSQPAPNGRKNRRRERPGARKRHALAHSHDVSEGILLASDSSFFLPQEIHRSGLRQNQAYERNWKAWKAREAEQKAATVERERKANAARMMEENKRLFGEGSGEDEELCEGMLGVVYALWGGIDYVDP